MPNVLFAKHFFWHTTVNTKNFVHFQSQQAQSLLPHFSEKVMYPPETSSKALLSHRIGKLCWTLVNRSAATCNCRQWPPETWLFFKRPLRKMQLPNQWLKHKHIYAALYKYNTSRTRKWTESTERTMKVQHELGRKLTWAIIIQT